MRICQVCERRGYWSDEADECPECRQKGRAVRFCRDCGRPSSEPQCESCRPMAPSGTVEIIPAPVPGAGQEFPYRPAPEFWGRPQSEIPPKGESGALARPTREPHGGAYPIQQNAPAERVVEIHHHHYPAETAPAGGPPRPAYHTGPPEQVACARCSKLPSQHGSTLYCPFCNKLYGWHIFKQMHFHCLGCGYKLY